MKHFNIIIFLINPDRLFFHYFHNLQHAETQALNYVFDARNLKIWNKIFYKYFYCPTYAQIYNS